VTVKDVGYMTGSPPFGPERQITLENWQSSPANQWGFQHTRELVPTASIGRGNGPVRELGRRERDVLGVTLRFGGEVLSVQALLEATQTDGFLVVHNGDVVAEHYFNDMQPDTPHLLMSVSKSITAAVAGCLVARGIVDVDAPITDLLPELSGTAFDGATARHLLDMRAGVAFDEDYDNVNADVRVYEQIYQFRPRVHDSLPSDALTYFTTLQREGPHGGPFVYRSILTDVLAWVLERASDTRFSTLVARELWSPMGAEFDAEVTLDSHGNAMADGGICATLRDLARFGLQYLAGGANGPFQAVPASWVADTIAGAPDGSETFELRCEQPGFPPGSHYRSGWWVRSSADRYLHASGIYGQNVFVHGASNTVVVKLSSGESPLDRQALDATAAAVVAIGTNLES
jgi:hypothetical protein